MNKYEITFSSPPANLRYWPKGISVNQICSGNSQMEVANGNGWKGNVRLLIQEKRQMLENMKQAGIPTIQLPYPDSAFLNANGITEDVEYIRDTMIAHPNKPEVMLFNMKDDSRKGEMVLYEALLPALGLSVVKSSQGINEGGNTRRFMMDNEKWLFAAVSVRSQFSALMEEVDFLEIPKNRQVILEVLNQASFHLDCVSMGVVSPNQFNFYAWMDAFTSQSRDKIEEVVRSLGNNLYPLSQEESAALIPNQLQYGEHIFSSGKFLDPATQTSVESVVNMHYSPLTQNQHTGGAVHCLNNEIWLPEPIDVASVNHDIAKLGIFPEGQGIQIWNEYE